MATSWNFVSQLLDNASQLFLGRSLSSFSLPTSLLGGFNTSSLASTAAAPTVAAASSYTLPHGPGEWPSPVGLSLGLLSVAVGQVFVLVWFYFRREVLKCSRFIQTEKKENYDFWEGVTTHLAQPEGFVLLGSYLSLTWMFNLMPASYYDMSGSVNWYHVLAQLAIVDALQTVMHYLEHKLSPAVYKASHKPHHKWLNPRLFDAFNGSLGDTICMILIPLFITANIVHCNVWSYMAFGTIYANYLTLIHSEFPNPWDHYVSYLGIGTAADHHVHHRLFKFNYGHLFMWWDRLLGTYKSPHDVKQFDHAVL
ncbi:hypothetical protein PTSG_10510 [Salpingoeca rosetta]|uniref:Fatty acid hydroxylase domain-containing protein n=1 Tax=Salpingoeca rosetta (strain ATCC 50818 / BSB-021) TaxID=946362 RepID=F2UPV5_SALR5|nr:uncharacterized protein PTSG_10510 [Salpingoeca rosetta]AYI99275.1 alternative squalene epoxidase [synthetic construct]EGD79660.1 hypothetical protein PTSG_10510 [Salpingoeca rosetta]|eukprot:XP_004988888.1 hypothetical protein PTSG_10510 [Salpingoeca rosetta]